MYPAFFINTSTGTINRNAISYVVCNAWDYPNGSTTPFIEIHLIGGKQPVILADEEAERFLDALAPSLTIGILSKEDDTSRQKTDSIEVAPTPAMGATEG